MGNAACGQMGEGNAWAPDARGDYAVERGIHRLLHCRRPVHGTVARHIYGALQHARQALFCKTGSMRMITWEQQQQQTMPAVAALQAARPGLGGCAAWITEQQHAGCMGVLPATCSQWTCLVGCHLSAAWAIQSTDQHGCTWQLGCTTGEGHQAEREVKGSPYACWADW